jgi:Fungal specific transcription factor domain
LLFPDIQKSDDERAEYTLVGPINAFQRPIIRILSRVSRLAHQSRVQPPPSHRGFPALASTELEDELEHTARQLEHELDLLWEQKRPPVIDDLMTFESADEVFRTRWKRGVPTAQRVVTIHRACVIFLWRVRTDRKLIDSPWAIRDRTWDQDGIDEQPEYVTRAVDDILTVTRDIVKSKVEKERRFMLFPLLCAGLECRDIAEQEFILHVLDVMSYVSWGTNFPKTKALLEEIFKRQGGTRTSTHGAHKVEGRWRRVDWLGVMFEMGPIVFV